LVNVNTEITGSCAGFGYTRMQLSNFVELQNRGFCNWLNRIGMKTQLVMDL
jgi:hypothetical protein